jgi:glycosyltransferase involved in cell wall biosynthesis
LPYGVINHKLPLTRTPSFFSALSSFLILLRLLITYRFSVIQYCTPMASLVASIAGFVSRVPVRIYAQWGLRYVSLVGVEKKILKQAEKTTCRLSTIIQPDSFGNLSFSISEGLYKKNKGLVVGNGSAIGIDTDYFDITKLGSFTSQAYSRLQINKKSFVFGFLGSVRSDKGCNELVKAFILACQDKYNNDILLIVGDHDYAYELDKEVLHALKNNPRIICVGPTKDIRPFLAITNCFVFPSYREGFGMSIIEAAALGVPAIASNIPGPNEAIKNYYTGILFPVRDVSALTKAMLFMRENPDRYNIMGQQALNYVINKYGSHDLMRKFVDNKNSLINNYTKSHNE